MCNTVSEPIARFVSDDKVRNSDRLPYYVISNLHKI